VSSGHRLQGNACRDRAAKDTVNAIQQAHDDNHSGKAMEVLLTLAQQEGKEFCAGLPLVPTLDDVSCWLASECRLDVAAPGVPPRRERSTLRDSPDDGDTTFFLGKGVAMRLAHGPTIEAMNAVGFFLYTQCDGNKGDKWPSTLGAFSRLKCVNNMLEYRADASWVLSVYARMRDFTLQSQRMWRQRVQARRRAGAPT
jgi:hypothetical protein